MSNTDDVSPDSIRLWNSLCLGKSAAGVRVSVELGFDLGENINEFCASYLSKMIYENVPPPH